MSLKPHLGQTSWWILDTSFLSHTLKCVCTGNDWLVLLTLGLILRQTKTYKSLSALCSLIVGFLKVLMQHSCRNWRRNTPNFMLQYRMYASHHTVLWITHIAPFVPKNSKNFTTFSGIWSRLIRSPDTLWWAGGVSHSENLPDGTCKCSSRRVLLEGKAIPWGQPTVWSLGISLYGMIVRITFNYQQCFLFVLLSIYILPENEKSSNIDFQKHARTPFQTNHEDRPGRRSRDEKS